MVILSNFFLTNLKEIVATSIDLLRDRITRTITDNQKLSKISIDSKFQSVQFLNIIIIDKDKIQLIELPRKI